MEKTYDERWRRRRPVWTYRLRRPWRATCGGNESAQTSALPYSGGRLREDGAAFATTSATYCMASACAMNAKEVMESSSVSPTPVFSFLRASFQVSTSFLEEEMISSFYTLSPQ
jgi:hypothetical protein